MPADVDLPVRNLIYTLAQRGDLALLAESSLRCADDGARREAEPVAVEVVSAVPLTDAERQALVAPAGKPSTAPGWICAIGWIPPSWAA